MTLPAGFGDLDFGEWFRGLVAAFVSGGSSAVTSGITVSAMDPRDYHFGAAKLYTLMLTMFLVNGLLGMFMFLRSKPVPDHKIVTTTVEETAVKPSGVTIVKTIEETHAEPVVEAKQPETK